MKRRALLALALVMTMFLAICVFAAGQAGKSGAGSAANEPTMTAADKPAEQGVKEKGETDQDLIASADGPGVAKGKDAVTGQSSSTAITAPEGAFVGDSAGAASGGAPSGGSAGTASGNVVSDGTAGVSGDAVAGESAGATSGATSANGALSPGMQVGELPEDSL